MENNSVWLEKITGEIFSQQERLSDEDNKKYKLDVLLRVVKRVASFSDDCEKCKNSRVEINKLVDRLGKLSHQSTEERKNYFYTLNFTIRHLQKLHKLIPKGYNTGIGIALGVLLGIGFGFAISKIWLGIPVGISFGLALGGSLDAKAKKKGRVL